MLVMYDADDVAATHHIRTLRMLRMGRQMVQRRQPISVLPNPEDKLAHDKRNMS